MNAPLGLVTYSVLYVFFVSVLGQNTGQPSHSCMNVFEWLTCRAYINARPSSIHQVLSHTGLIITTLLTTLFLNIHFYGLSLYLVADHTFCGVLKTFNIICKVKTLLCNNFQVICLFDTVHIQVILMHHFLLKMANSDPLTDSRAAVE